ncbi:cation symporter, AGCS family domain protein [Vibrio parahaemolyticus V-223/04]|nr:cation symporter, AGCS family domain protein [Vibrio parahaemolyticus NIHCB0603]EVT80162.1 cation symporter, AGCS family domain protein [Vibrio parahaemolyticus V14/01]EVU19777.1 cation symporter, AGCS family domain protein [Vibrio parahaemolyticus V-223/04]EWM38258.1 cation symporter, AGCS family domain protein [Vibrio parahaemolyticus EKP-021]EXJ37028.1 cation symporter, AGCS family domain protein [Vibrio parahaemolyticus VP-48]
MAEVAELDESQSNGEVDSYTYKKINQNRTPKEVVHQID